MPSAPHRMRLFISEEYVNVNRHRGSGGSGDGEIVILLSTMSSYRLWLLFHVGRILVVLTAVGPRGSGTNVTDKRGAAR